MELHKAKVGYTPAQAESEFLQICKKLPRYGMHLFVVKVIGNCIVLSYVFVFLFLFWERGKEKNEVT